MTEPLLTGHGLCKGFGPTKALRDASLAVGEGEVVAVTGPSGSGKSTLMLTLAGVLQPDAGAVRFGGVRLSDLSEAERSRLRRREFGIVFQFGGVVPELTVLQNVALPLLLDGHARSSAFLQATRWLERLNGHALIDALPGQLSGGQLQRVAIARALVASPRVIFADEPTGALDTVSADVVLHELLTAAKSTAASLVLITHDNRVAARADREVVLRDGRIEGEP